MSDTVFFIHAIVLHIISLSMAVTLHKIEFLFDLIGAIMISFSVFLLPAIGFLTAYYHKDSVQWQESQSTKTFYYVLAWFFLPLGVFMIISSLTLNILRLTGHIQEE